MELSSNISGWLSEWDEELLLELSKECIPPFLEIGSYHWKATAILADNTPWTVITMDIFPRDTLEKFEENKRPNVIYLKGNSLDILPLFHWKFWLIFIDGGHDLKTVLNDWLLAWELLREWGYICFHDYRSRKWVDVRLAVDALMKKWQVQPYKISWVTLCLKK